MTRRHFLRAASGLFVPAIAGHAALPMRLSDPAFLGGRRRASSGGGEPTSPLDDPDLWGFWRSDEQLYYDPGAGDKIECVTYPDPDGWVDTSPTAREMDIAASCLGPVYNASGPNGKPSVDFNINQTPMNTSGLVTISQPYTVFVLGYVDDLIGSNRYIMDSEDGGGAKGALLTQDGTGVTMYSGSFGPTLTPLPLDEWMILTMIFDGASSSIGRNNDAVQTGNPGTTGCTAFGFNGWGGSPGLGSTQVQFRLAAVIVTDVHSSSEWIANHKAWLAWFGGLTI